tara:strand:- start:3401 stop:3820 length:420 start_codon:yes stop_codon:yes gene_type:complete
MSKKFEAMVLSCIDPRFQPKVFSFLKKRKLIGQYSAFTIAGAAVGVTHIKFKKWHDTFLDNISTSIHLHKINKLIVVNHRDCGAAKIVNYKNEFNKDIEEKIHKNSFKKLKKILNKKFPKLYSEFYLMTLKGSIKKFNV